MGVFYAKLVICIHSPSFLDVVLEEVVGDPGVTFVTPASAPLVDDLECANAAASSAGVCFVVVVANDRDHVAATGTLTMAWGSDNVSGSVRCVVELWVNWERYADQFVFAVRANECVFYCLTFCCSAFTSAEEEVEGTQVLVQSWSASWEDVGCSVWSNWLYGMILSVVSPLVTSKL